MKKQKEQRVFIEKKEGVAEILNIWTQGSSPYNVKMVKELRCGLLFIVLTR